MTLPDSAGTAQAIRQAKRRRRMHKSRNYDGGARAVPLLHRSPALLPVDREDNRRQEGNWVQRSMFRSPRREGLIDLLTAGFVQKFFRTFAEYSLNTESLSHGYETLAVDEIADLFCIKVKIAGQSRLAATSGSGVLEQYCEPGVLGRHYAASNFSPSGTRSGRMLLTGIPVMAATRCICFAGTACQLVTADGLMPSWPANFVGPPTTLRTCSSSNEYDIHFICINKSLQSTIFCVRDTLYAFCVSSRDG